MKLTMGVVAGIAAGVAFVFACGGGKRASAGPADCASWQFAQISVNCPLDAQLNINICAVPSGWEPLKEDSSGGPTNAVIDARRCAP
jgi:hypothetical protein